jgi:hypothetical protein
MLNRAALLVAAAVTLSGCFGHVTVYRNLREPRAMRTCNANKLAQAHAPGHNEPSAMKNTFTEAKRYVRAANGCGLYVIREGYDRTNRVGYLDYQVCECHDLRY